MDPVKELDIDGFRWEITDPQARQEISALKSDTKIVYVGEMELTLKPGYTAYYAKLQHVIKVGKLIMGSIHFIGLAGEGIGEPRSVMVAELPFSPLELFEVVAVETNRNYAFRVSGSADRNVYIISTGNLIPGSSDVIGSFVAIEA